MDPIYTQTAYDIGRIITRNYSTSFYSATNLLDKSIREEIYGIYGFVRLADEIVDSFAAYDQKSLFNRLETDYAACRHTGFSINPILYAFQCVAIKYAIPNELVDSFLESMRADLNKKIYTSHEEAQKYIYGSAEAVGLMCLRVFVKGDEESYEKLAPAARKLGSAFQKVNFLRDLRHDMEVLDRCYFPGVNRQNFNEHQKQRIIEDIEADFAEAYPGIKALPQTAQLGVYTAYVYYQKLLQKIKRTPAHKLISQRIRISDTAKAGLLMQTFVMTKAGMI
ncbi:MAG: phytoene/squalene synthase family protein [Bacteroidales bacterium]